MPVDSLLKVRDTSDAALVATGDWPATPIYLGGNYAFDAGFCFEVLVPAVVAATTLDITLKESATIAGTYTTHTTLPQITAAGLYARRFKQRLPWFKATFTVAGVGPAFGSVTAYVKDSSREADGPL